MSGSRTLVREHSERAPETSLVVAFSLVISGLGEFLIGWLLMCTPRYWAKKPQIPNFVFFYSAVASREEEQPVREFGAGAASSKQQQRER
jgi:hypothetical protein